MLNIEELNKLKSYAYMNSDGELGEKIEKEIYLLEEIEEEREKINKLNEGGWNFLDIANRYSDQGNYTYFEDDIFVVVLKNYRILFQDSCFEIAEIIPE